MLREFGVLREFIEEYLCIKGEVKLVERLYNYGLESY